MLMITGYLRQRSAHRRRRRKLILEFLNSLKRREKYIQSAILLKSELENSIQKPRIRTCRRLPRNTGWWETVSTRYSEKRFKKNFRVSKETFRFLAGELEALERESVAEDPISVEERLAITLYRLGRGSYYSRVPNSRGGVFSENPIFFHQFHLIKTPPFYDFVSEVVDLWSLSYTNSSKIHLWH